MRTFSPRQLCTVGLTMSWLATGTATAQTAAPDPSPTLGTLEIGPSGGLPATGSIPANAPSLPATGTGQSAPAPVIQAAAPAVAPTAPIAPTTPLAPAAQQAACNNPQMANTQGCKLDTKLNAAANNVNNTANAVAAPVNAASNAAKQLGAAFGGLFGKPAPAPAAPTPPPQSGH